MTTNVGKKTRIYEGYCKTIMYGRNDTKIRMTGKEAAINCCPFTL